MLSTHLSLPRVRLPIHRYSDTAGLGAQRFQSILVVGGDVVVYAVYMCV